MTPDQIVALLQLMADLRLQVGQLMDENAALRSQLAATTEEPET